MLEDMNIRNRTTAAIKPTLGFCTSWNLGEDRVRATTTEMPRNASEVRHHSRPAMEEEGSSELPVLCHWLGCQARDKTSSQCARQLTSYKLKRRKKKKGLLIPTHSIFYSQLLGRECTVTFRWNIFLAEVPLSLPALAFPSSGVQAGWSRASVGFEFWPCHFFTKSLCTFLFSPVESQYLSSSRKHWGVKGCPSIALHASISQVPSEDLELPARCSWFRRRPGLLILEGSPPHPSSQSPTLPPQYPFPAFREY